MLSFILWFQYSNLSIGVEVKKMENRKNIKYTTRSIWYECEYCVKMVCFYLSGFVWKTDQ